MGATDVVQDERREHERGDDGDALRDVAARDAPEDAPLAGEVGRGVASRSLAAVARSPHLVVHRGTMPSGSHATGIGSAGAGDEAEPLRNDDMSHEQAPTSGGSTHRALRRREHRPPRGQHVRAGRRQRRRLGVGFLTFVAVTRGLGSDGFGTLTTALVFLIIPVVLADVGLSTALLREISADPPAPRRRCARRCRCER